MREKYQEALNKLNNPFNRECEAQLRKQLVSESIKLFNKTMNKNCLCRKDNMLHICHQRSNMLVTKKFNDFNEMVHYEEKEVDPSIDHITKCINNQINNYIGEEDNN